MDKLDTIIKSLEELRRFIEWMITKIENLEAEITRIKKEPK